MSDSNKPLFSRPVLAAIMLFCTLAIWLLNLTATSSTTLPTPKVETWTTTSGVPVIWLKQEAWENSNKVEIRFAFRSVTTNTALIEMTLAMLMSDSLPLSTASINQRLSPLAASANSYYDHENQVIGLTLNNETDYLLPSLSLVTKWLKSPDFKRRTFDHWQAQRPLSQGARHELEDALFFDSTAENVSLNRIPTSLEHIIEYYESLKNSAVAIYVVGDLTLEAQQSIQAALNAISQDFQIAKGPAEQIQHEPFSSTIQQSEGELWQTRSAIALKPVTTIKEWMSLQIWGADLVSTLNQQQHIDFVQLALTLSPTNPWAWWSTQYSNNPIIAPTASNKKTNQIINAKSLVLIEQVPSIQHEETFHSLLDAFKKQLETQALSPAWWSYIATQITHLDSQLTLDQFAKNYQEAVSSFTAEDYHKALSQLLIPSSYQEIQVYQ